MDSQVDVLVIFNAITASPSRGGTGYSSQETKNL